MASGFVSRRNTLFMQSMGFARLHRLLFRFRWFTWLFPRVFLGVSFYRIVPVPRIAWRAPRMTSRRLRTHDAPSQTRQEEEMGSWDTLKMPHAMAGVRKRLGRKGSTRGHASLSAWWQSATSRDSWSPLRDLGKRAWALSMRRRCSRFVAFNGSIAQAPASCAIWMRALLRRRSSRVLDS